MKMYPDTVWERGKRRRFTFKDKPANGACGRGAEEADSLGRWRGGVEDGLILCWIDTGPRACSILGKREAWELIIWVWYVDTPRPTIPWYYDIYREEVGRLKMGK